MKSPDVLVAIPQKGHQAMTAELVRQIRRFEDAPILVLDDESPTGVCDWKALEDEFGVDVRETGGTGLTAAWNMALDAADGRPVVLLNNDVVCRGEFLATLVEAAGEKGISGAKRRFDKDAEMEVLEGWCLCIGPKRAATQRFDESMRLYFSDTDYQIRAKVVPVAVPVPLTHIGHATCHDESILRGEERVMIWRADRAVFKRRWGQ